MLRSECYKILELDEGAGPSAIKRAYRRLAFSLHPDLNPGLTDAAQRFQRLNEAYVLLMQEYGRPNFSSAGKASDADGRETDAKTRAEAHKAYEQASRSFKQQGGASSSTGPRASQHHGPGPKSDQRREDVLRDLLNDPFARRVFEDIYSHLHHSSGRPSKANKPVSVPYNIGIRHKSKEAKAKPGRPSLLAAAGGKVMHMAGGLKNWMRRQIDDEQVMLLPGENLVPGTRLRLQVRHGLSGAPQNIELTLPPEFTIGRPVRLKGLGKRLGSLRGDLYLNLLPKTSTDEDEGEEN